MISYTRVRTSGTGVRVALVAPSGPLVGESDVLDAVANVKSFGWEPVVGTHVLDRYSYFSAIDDARARDINTMLRDDNIDIIWCLRGGHGAMRILPTLDFDALRVHPKTIIGYSDITALHAAFGRTAHVITYHAPNARTPLTGLSLDSFARAMRGENPCGHAPHARTIRGGTARGRLAGGNLALVSSIAGTPYFPDMRDAILVLEDVNEALYRIDRMLTQLLLTGALEGLAGIACGQFTGSDADETPDDSRLSRTLDEVLGEFADTLRVPCIAGIPMGHIDHQWTIPLGDIATLDADRLTLNAGDA